jgi:hypothetical protein
MSKYLLLLQRHSLFADKKELFLHDVHSKSLGPEQVRHFSLQGLQEYSEVT